MAEGAIIIEPDGRIYSRLGASDEDVREAGRTIFRALADNPKLIERNSSLVAQRNILLTAILMVKNSSELLDKDGLREALAGVVAKCASLEPSDETTKQ